MTERDGLTARRANLVVDPPALIVSVRILRAAQPSLRATRLQRTRQVRSASVGRRKRHELFRQTRPQNKPIERYH